MKLYKFEATPTVQNGQVTAWKLCYIESQVSYPDCGYGTAQDPYPNVKVPPGPNTKNQPFQFNILGDTGIAFAPASQNPGDPGPIWIHKKGDPTGPGIHPQIDTPGGGGSQQLTFINRNTQEVTLKYQLNFVDAQGKAVTALDPEIINGGKNRLSDNSAFMISAGVAVALLALWAWRVFAARRTGQ